MNSAQLKKFEKQGMPDFSKVKVAEFEILGKYFDEELKREICPRKIQVPQEYTVYDPETNEPIKMSWGVRPWKTPKSGNDDVMIEKELFFSRANTGIIRLTPAERVDNRELAVFLYLHPMNIVNQGKSWNTMPAGGYKFKYLDRETEAKQDIANTDLRAKALGAVASWDETALRHYAKALWPHDQATMGPNELKRRFYDKAEKDPQAILVLKDSKEDDIRAKVQEFHEAGLISLNTEKGVWTWPDGKKITSVKADKTANESLANYLKTYWGENDLKILEQQLQSKVAIA